MHHYLLGWTERYVASFGNCGYKSLGRPSATTREKSQSRVLPESAYLIGEYLGKTPRWGSCPPGLSPGDTGISSPGLVPVVTVSYYTFEPTCPHLALPYKQEPTVNSQNIPSASRAGLGPQHGSMAMMHREPRHYVPMPSSCLPLGAIEAVDGACGL